MVEMNTLAGPNGTIGQVMDALGVRRGGSWNKGPFSSTADVPSCQNSYGQLGGLEQVTVSFFSFAEKH